MGNTLNTGVAYVMRASMLAAGMPYTTPFEAVNRFCSSGLMAVSAVANRIKAGEISVGLAGGFENMSTTCVGVSGFLSDFWRLTSRCC